MLTDRELDILRRRARGESQHSIATALGISQAAISKMESNAQRKIIEAEHHLQLLASFGVTTEEGISGKKVVYTISKENGKEIGKEIGKGDKSIVGNGKNENGKVGAKTTNGHWHGRKGGGAA